jgi:hypothetical protein
MYSKLNIGDIIQGHKEILGKGKNKSHYRIEFVILPLLASLVLILVKVPDNDVKNIFGVCLSILTGLYLNILVLLISSISAETKNIGAKDKKVRLELLQETLYNVSFSVFKSVKGLIVLFASTIIFVNWNSLDNLCYILINHDFNFLIQFLFGFLLYKYTIDIFLILFMILKRINSIYTKEIYIERLRLNQLENEELKK